MYIFLSIHGPPPRVGDCCATYQRPLHTFIHTAVLAVWGYSDSGDKRTGERPEERSRPLSPLVVGACFPSYIDRRSWTERDWPATQLYLLGKGLEQNCCGLQRDACIVILPSFTHLTSSVTHAAGWKKSKRSNPPPLVVDPLTSQQGEAPTWPRIAFLAAGRSQVRGVCDAVGRGLLR